MEWNDDFLNPGSTSAKKWTQLMSKAVPAIHFVSEYKIATVEIRKISFFEFNDQVVFTSKMDVITDGNIQVNPKNIAGSIFENLKDFGDPGYSNKVRCKSNIMSIDGRPCHKFVG